MSKTSFSCHGSGNNDVMSQEGMTVIALVCSNNLNSIGFFLLYMAAVFMWKNMHSIIFGKRAVAYSIKSNVVPYNHLFIICNFSVTVYHNILTKIQNPLFPDLFCLESQIMGYVRCLSLAWLTRRHRRIFTTRIVCTFNLDSNLN